MTEPKKLGFVRTALRAALTVALASTLVLLAPTLSADAQGITKVGSQSPSVSVLSGQVASSRQTKKVPKVVGMHGNTAKKKLAKAGFKVKLKAPKGSFVVLSSHWKVKKQTPKAGSRAKKGTQVVLKVVKIKKKPEAAPKVSPSDPNLPQEFEADLKEQLGGQPFTNYCSINGWPCYVAGFAQSVPDTIVITLQVDNSAASKTLGAQAARAAFSLTGKEFPSLQWVVVNSASGTFLAQIQRSAVPLLNR